MTWDWQYAREILPDLLQGLVITVEATFLGSLLALVLGALIAIARRSHRRIIAWSVGGFVEFVRSTPFLVQLYFIFFVLPTVGLTLSPLLAGTLGLGLHYSTYASEAYRGGINGVPRGQWEAAAALNLSGPRTWTSVILPQAIPSVVPTLANYVIAMFKETPVLSAITVAEMLSRAQTIGSANFRYLEPVIMVGALFLLVSYPTSLLARRLEARLMRYYGTRHASSTGLD